MPHIYIKEIDNTVAGISEENTNVVYVPGIIEKNGTLVLNTPTLYLTVSAFLKDITGDETGTLSRTNTSAIAARELISLGLPVLFEGIAKATGATIPSIDTAINSINWEKLKDKSLYQFKFMVAGFTASTGSTISENMLEVAGSRGDCIALIDHAKTISPASGSTYAGTVYELFSTIATDDNSKYAAAFSPWCKFALKEGEIELPGSFAFLSSYAKSIRKNPNWYAAAGSFRGQIPSLISPLYAYGDADCATLQHRIIDEDGAFGEGDNLGYAVNPICQVRPFGVIVWGNRTLVDNSDTNGLVASSFLNIRNLCCDIKKTLYKAARKFTFEQNSDVLWENFRAEIIPLLDKALSGNGVRGYKLLRQETGIRGRLKAVIKIIPIEAVEDFDLTVEMTDTLEDVTESV